MNADQRIDAPKGESLYDEQMYGPIGGNTNPVPPPVFTCLATAPARSNSVEVRSAMVDRAIGHYQLRVALWLLIIAISCTVVWSSLRRAVQNTAVRVEIVLLVLAALGYVGGRFLALGRPVSYAWTIGLVGTAWLGITIFVDIQVYSTGAAACPGSCAVAHSIGAVFYSLVSYPLFQACVFLGLWRGRAMDRRMWRHLHPDLPESR